MTMYVICNVVVEGFHCWENAPAWCDYLRNTHRHMFNIEMHVPVTEANREIEFIDYQRQIKNTIIEEFGDDRGYAQFGGLSCEHIAQWLLEKYPNATYCMVIEDDNGGSLIVR